MLAVVALVAAAAFSHRLYEAWWPPISCSADVLGTEDSMTRDECQVLAAIYEANTRRGDLLKFEGRFVPASLSDWESEPNPCLWVAAICRDGHLAELRLVGYDYPRYFVVPPEIDRLSHLVGLTVDVTGFAPLPDEIGELGSLESLVLSGELTYGADSIDVRGLVNLHELSLTTRQRFPVVGLDQLSRLASLTLSIDVAIPDDVFELTGLTRLQLLGPKTVAFSRAIPLRELPPEIARLGQLAELSVRGNELVGLPTEIGELSELESLDLTANEISTFPLEVGQLPGLRHLSLAGNHLLSLPPEVGELESLESLDVKRNRLYELRPELASLSNLSSLTIGGNRFRGVPDEVYQINPAQLDLSGGELSEFKVEPGQLSRLTDLDLSENQFRQFPVDVALLPSLRRLDLSANSLDELPPEVGELTELDRLDLSNNGFKFDVTDALAPFVHEPGYQSRLDISGNCLFSTDPELQAFIDEQGYAPFCGYLGDERR